jgi:hypothetical protein
MSGWYAGRLRLALMLCAAAQLLAACPAFALTKLIVVPTARTIGARRYQVDLSRKQALLDDPDISLDISVKAGLGQRVMVEGKVPLRGGNNNPLWFGKYTFAATRGGLTAVAIGVENVGQGSQPIPYLVSSHLFRSADLTVGIARGVDAVAKYFAGADYRVGDKLHLLGDYNTGSTTYASAGFQYDFTQNWSLKSGWEASHTSAADVLVKIQFTNGY